MRDVKKLTRCPLCLEDKEIVVSHLIPQAMYDYCRTKDSEPVPMTSKIVTRSSQVMNPTKLKFGDFELDVVAYKLRRSGRAVKAGACCCWWIAADNW